MVYQWKSASFIKADAQKAGEVCEQLEKTVGLTAKNLLDASRDEFAPLHNEFEWDDNAAAELYRENQARHIINCLIVKEEESKEEEPKQVRAFFTLENSEYESIHTILQSVDKQQGLLLKALSELDAFERKYNSLKELIGVFNEAKKVKESIA